MVSTVVAVVVAGCADAAFWTATEFANADNKCFVQQTAIVKILQQRRKSRIEHRSRFVFHALRQTNMNVPRMTIRICNLRPVNFHNPRSGFDQSPCQQTTLAKRRATILVAKFFLLRPKIKRLPRATG